MDFPFDDFMKEINPSSTMDFGSNLEYINRGLSYWTTEPKWTCLSTG